MSQIPREFAVRMVAQHVPDAAYILSFIESEDGYLKFPPFLTRVLQNPAVAQYPLLYKSEGHMALVMLKCFFDEDEISQLTSIKDLSKEDDVAYLMSCIDGVSNAADQIKIPRTPREEREAMSAFDCLTPAEQKEAAQFGVNFFSFTFAMFFETLSIMVHGEKLTSLVSQAKQGNDNAFVKAVQIDRRILTVDPYFRDRYNNPENETDRSFHSLLSYRLSVPPYRGKIRYKTLWLTFSLLEKFQLLESMTHSELLDFCDEVGVGRYDSRIDSVTHLSRRLREYRDFQKRGIVTST